MAVVHKIQANIMKRFYPQTFILSTIKYYYVTTKLLRNHHYLFLSSETQKNIFLSFDPKIYLMTNGTRNIK